MEDIDKSLAKIVGGNIKDVPADKLPAVPRGDIVLSSESPTTGTLVVVVPFTTSDGRKLEAVYEKEYSMLGTPHYELKGIVAGTVSAEEAAKTVVFDPEAAEQYARLHNAYTTVPGWISGVGAWIGQLFGTVLPDPADELARARRNKDIILSAALPPPLPVQLKDPKTGRFIPDPKKPRSPYPEMTDTERRAEWKRLVEDPNSGLTEEQRAQIKARGYRGPQRTDKYGETETMELSHEPVPRRDGGTKVVPLWPDEHAARDRYRQLRKR